jgi:hypothetical protein
VPAVRKNQAVIVQRRGHDPRFVNFADDQRRHSEGEGNGEPDEAGVEQWRVRHHVGVFQQWIESAAVERDR